MTADTPEAPPAGITEVWTKDEFLETVLEAEMPVVVDFWAAWCGPCGRLAPIFAALAEAHPEVRFVKVDTDRARAIAEAVGIKSLPTIGFYLNGRLEDVFVGVRTRKQLEKRIVSLQDKAAGKGFFQRLLGR